MVCFERVSPTLLMCRGDVADWSITLKKSLRYFWEEIRVKSLVKVLLSQGEEKISLETTSHPVGKSCGCH